MVWRHFREILHQQKFSAIRYFWLCKLVPDTEPEKSFVFYQQDSLPLQLTWEIMRARRWMQNIWQSRAFSQLKWAKALFHSHLFFNCINCISLTRCHPLFFLSFFFFFFFFFFFSFFFLFFFGRTLWYGCYSRAAFISLEKPANINNGWIRHIQAIQWQLLDAVSSKDSIWVLLSAMDTSRTTRTALALAQWLSTEIICINAHIVAVSTIWGWCLFRSELLIVRLLFQRIVAARTVRYHHLHFLARWTARYTPSLHPVNRTGAILLS